MRKLITILTVIFGMATFCIVIGSIWVSGDTSARLGHTALVTGFVTIIGIMVATFPGWEDPHW